MWIGENPEDIEAVSKVVRFLDTNLNSYGLESNYLRVIVSNVSVSPPNMRDWLRRFSATQDGIDIDVAEIREELRRAGKNDADEHDLLNAITNRISKSVAYKLLRDHHIYNYDNDLERSIKGWFKYTLFPEIGELNFPVRFTQEKDEKLRAVFDETSHKIYDCLHASAKIAALIPSLSPEEFVREVMSETRRKGYAGARSYARILWEESQTQKQYDTNSTNLNKTEFIDRAAARRRKANERITDEYPLRMRDALINALKTAGSDPVAFWRAIAEQAADNINETVEGCSYISNALIAVVLYSYNDAGEGLRRIFKNPDLTEYKTITEPQALDAINALVHSLETLPVTYHVDLPTRKKPSPR